VNKIGGDERNLLAEDSMLVAFTGDPSDPVWLAESDAEKLLSIKPDANVPPDLAAKAFSQIREGIQSLEPALSKFVEQRGTTLLEAHRRVRSAAGAKGTYRIESNPPDVLGVYVFLPIPKL